MNCWVQEQRVGAGTQQVLRGISATITRPFSPPPISSFLPSRSQATLSPILLFPSINTGTHLLRCVLRKQRRSNSRLPGDLPAEGSLSHPHCCPPNSPAMGSSCSFSPKSQACRQPAQLHGLVKMPKPGEARSLAQGHTACKCERWGCLTPEPLCWAPGLCWGRG